MFRLKVLGPVHPRASRCESQETLPAKIVALEPWIGKVFGLLRAGGAALEFCVAAGGAAESPGAALCVERAESCGWVCGVAHWAVASSGPAHSTIASTRHSDRSSVGRITVPLSPRHPWKFRLKTLRHKPRIALWRNC